jgi:hypothetical protein
VEKTAVELAASEDISRMDDAMLAANTHMIVPLDSF